ncbi:MAG: hypothetical protein BJBARM5_0837 [Candidatus Parvarchaeum acidophilus ARMAN-5]|uniref:Uncharacterized protein n=1 Tax=Candidatus Parvarchaeum acidophilus ARMAN-5 TaxID=662762 RepID=D6GWF5_PARA5|nr:MAG: hypothetical protein BJBARM5_0837 [Candidatus Parvarchaeum acidophilus ARMAN-5]
MEVNLRKFSDIIDKHHKKIIAIWIIIFLISIPVAIHLFSVVSYNVTSSSNNSSSGNSVQLIVSVSNNSFSNSSKSFFERISDAFTYRNITSIYSVEYNILNSSYYTIKKNSEIALSLAYSKYNLTPKTAPKSINNTIIEKNVGLMTGSGEMIPFIDRDLLKNVKVIKLSGTGMNGAYIDKLRQEVYSNIIPSYGHFYGKSSIGFLDENNLDYYPTFPFQII